MTGVNFTSYIRFLTKTNSSTFTDAEIVLIANIVKDDIAKEIVKVDEDFFGVYMDANIKASSTSDPKKREYPLDDDQIRIKKVEAQFDGTNWVDLIPFDLTQYDRTTDENTIIAQFSNTQGNAYYDIFRQSLWIYSGTTTVVTDGLKMHGVVNPEDIDASDLASSNQLSVPSVNTASRLPLPFHELWARRISITYKSGKEKPIPLSDLELAYAADFELALEAINNQNLDQDIVAEREDDSDMQL